MYSHKKNISSFFFLRQVGDLHEGAINVQSLNPISCRQFVGKTIEICDIDRYQQYQLLYDLITLLLDYTKASNTTFVGISEANYLVLIIEIS